MINQRKGEEKMKKRIEIGVEIDNTAGQYSQHEILDRLIMILKEYDNRDWSDIEDEITRKTDPQILTEIEDEIIDKINDALIDNVSDFVYFGLSDHESGLYGFWPSVEAALNDEYTLRVEDLPDYIIQVNDHGNVTLYKVTLEEVWSVV